ncbi:MAG: HAD family phosphatase [Trichlorobacter sp.]|uniref:HAD family hydrolase n=1 Tax=Trichlorobacter sp. TaxID=2911007 RepID=UPI002564CEC6|nr:HAD family phosphatase [Trichlorobacter sp.]MDK9718648.1 HAD family phosphatase [Trichlorobacter sp.]
MYPDAVIFDFDGVIVDTEPIHYQVFQQILEPLGMGYSWQEYTDTYMGFDDRDAFREAFRTAGKELGNDTLQTLINQKASLFEQVVARGVVPYPGVVELIKDLSDKQIPLAISSGALRSDIMPILEQLGIKQNFTHIVTADDVPQSKPHPASYLKAKELLLHSFPEQLNPKSSIFAIEDTPAGIQSAKGAGLNVVAVTNSYPIAKLGQADATVQILSELSTRAWTQIPPHGTSIKVSC